MYTLMLLILLVPSTIYRAMVLTVMWRWFIVPLGLPVLNIPTAIGVTLVCAYLTWQNLDDDKPMDEKKFVKLCARMIFSPAFFLLIAYITHLWM